MPNPAQWTRAAASTSCGLRGRSASSMARRMARRCCVSRFTGEMIIHSQKAPQAPLYNPAYDDDTTAATHRSRREGRHEGGGEGEALDLAAAPDRNQERAHPPGLRGR